MPEWNLDRATGRTADSYAEGVMHVSEFAMRQLGVTDDQAGALFNAYNALESLRSMRDLLHGKPTATYDELMSVA